MCCSSVDCTKSGSLGIRDYWIRERDCAGTFEIMILAVGAHPFGLVHPLPASTRILPVCSAADNSGNEGQNSRIEFGFKCVPVSPNPKP